MYPRKPGPVTRLSAANVPIVDAGAKYDQDDVEAALQAAITTAEHAAIGDGAPHHAPVTAGDGIIVDGQQVSMATPLPELHIDQSVDDAAIPVLTVDQADVSEEFIKFIGTSANEVLTQSIVEAADVGTATIAGYLKIFVQDDGEQLTDQAYFIPIYTLA